METIAVYWEPQIKTYGIACRTGLHLVAMQRPFSEIVNALKQLCLNADPVDALVLISAGSYTGGAVKTCLVLDLKVRKGQFQNLEQNLQGTHGPNRFEVVPDVEMICFHGPHYGDRYGIAYTVMNALTTNGVPLLTSACSASSVYLVVPQGHAQTACDALSSAVVVPKVQSRNER